MKHELILAFLKAKEAMTNLKLADKVRGPVAWRQTVTPKEPEKQNEKQT